MIVEQRDYHVHTGKLPELVRIRFDELDARLYHGPQRRPARVGRGSTPELPAPPTLAM